MTQMFSIENVSVAYGKVEAVRNVSLSVEEGQIVTVIGPNGAGKTTLLMAAIGLLKSTGRMIFQGADLSRIDVEGRVERGLCLVPEKRELFADIWGMEDGVGARSAVGMGPLPGNISVEIEAIFEIA